MQGFKPIEAIKINDELRKLLQKDYSTKDLHMIEL